MPVESGLAPQSGETATLTAGPPADRTLTQSTHTRTAGLLTSPTVTDP